MFLHIWHFKNNNSGHFNGAYKFIKAHFYVNASGEELGLRALYCCFIYIYISVHSFTRKSKEMSAKQQSSDQDEWQGN